MTATIYVNGRFLPHTAAAIQVEDRGYQFADAVYEVIAWIAGTPVDQDRHLGRLWDNLAALEIPAPCTRRVLDMLCGEVVRRNRLTDALVYIQVSRGTQSPRAHDPGPTCSRPVLTITARRHAFPRQADELTAIRVLCLPDPRWVHCNLKTTALLANCLARTEARRHDADDVWFLDREGLVTEGSSSNAWLVTADNTLVTRGLSHHILPGVTRTALMEVIPQLSPLRVEQRPFHPDELHTAREAFASSTSSFVKPVVSVDGRTIGNGRPGPVAEGLFAACLRHTTGL